MLGELVQEQVGVADGSWAGGRHSRKPGELEAKLGVLAVGDGRQWGLQLGHGTEEITDVVASVGPGADERDEGG